MLARSGSRLVLSFAFLSFKTYLFVVCCSFAVSLAGWLVMALLLTPVQKLVSWYTSRHPVDLWLELLRNAESFEDWEEAALHLDSLLGLDLW